VETLKILCSDKIQDFASTRLFPDQVVFNGLESCIVEYAHPGEELMNSIKKSCENYVDKRKYFPSLILLQNHGILCASNSMKNCVFATEICEKSAAVFLSAGSNSLTYLNEDQKEKIFYDKKEKYRINL
jgi:ribulose-5-phosphate 4-epimerase/fuculose-1-phosphate aldolase